MPGAGLPLEMEVLASGGARPMEVLHGHDGKCGKSLGMTDVGSHRAGKFADLIIWMPIPSRISAHAVHSLGDEEWRLYEGATLNEVWPAPAGAARHRARVMARRRLPQRRVSVW